MQISNRQPLQAPAAILPNYTPTGDISHIITLAGAVTQTPVSIRTILRRLARERSIDLTALKQNAAQATGQRILHILPFADDLVLVPVKVRIPQVGRDNCTGYVNACNVDVVRETSAPPYKSRIILQSGVEIPTLWTTATIEKHLRAARLFTAARAHGNTTSAQPELLAISRKLVEVFQEILALRSK